MYVIPSLHSIETYRIHFSSQKNVSQSQVTVNDAMRVKIQNSFDNLSHNVTSFRRKNKDITNLKFHAGYS